MKKFITENRVMLITAIIGTIVSVIYAIIVDFESDNWFTISLLVCSYYPLMWLIICIATRNRLKEPAWEATIITSPMYLGLLGLVIQSDFIVCFSVVLSLLILEYRTIKRRR